mgnify:CR=1 FL=1
MSRPGFSTDADGFVDLDSMGSPGTAKNVITIGASENDRQGNWDCDSFLTYTTCADQGGQNKADGRNMQGHGEALKQRSDDKVAVLHREQIARHAIPLPVVTQLFGSPEQGVDEQTGQQEKFRPVQPGKTPDPPADIFQKRHVRCVVRGRTAIG